MYELVAVAFEVADIMEYDLRAAGPWISP